MDFDLNNSIPIWKQLTFQLKERIASGEYKVGDKFPSVRELAAEAGVNPNTMQRAMAFLEAEGLVITNRTAGRTVTADESIINQTRTDLAKERTRKYLREMQALGYAAEDAVNLLKDGK